MCTRGAKLFESRRFSVVGLWFSKARWATNEWRAHGQEIIVIELFNKLTGVHQELWLAVSVAFRKQGIGAVYSR
jgi:hypothetical protein